MLLTIGQTNKIISIIQQSKKELDTKIETCLGNLIEQQMPTLNDDQIIEGIAIGKKYYSKLI